MVAPYPARIPTDVLTGEFVPEMWSLKAIDHVRSNLVMQNVVDTSWAAQLKLGDKLWIPIFAALTAAMIDTSIDSPNLAANATIGGTDVYVTIDQWQECPIQIDDSVQRQTQVGDLMGKATSNCGYAIAKAIDTDVAGLFEGLGGGFQGSQNQTFTDDIMIAMMEYLDEADVPRENRSLVIDPSTIADIYKIDKFVRLDYQKTAVSQTGSIGQMYGVPVYVTNNLDYTSTSGHGALIHKEAIGLVIQEKPTVEKSRWALRHSDLIIVSALWGADILRATFGKPFYTRLK